MNTENLKDFFNTGFLGTGRGIVVQTILNPIEVVRTQLQISQKKQKSHQIALDIFKEQGLGGFYKGFAAQTGKIFMTQFWRWSAIAGFPTWIDPQNKSPYLAQLFTGVGIATCDAVLTTPFESERIRNNKEKTRFSFKSMYRNKWSGFTSNWTNLSVGWSTFLVAQKFFRNDIIYRTGQQTLTPWQLTEVALKVTFVVTVVSMPFDNANALVHSKNWKASNYFSENMLNKMYKGLRLRTFALTIQNIASAFLFNILEDLKN